MTSIQQLVVLAVVVASLNGCQKTQLDAEARQRCSQDGGVVVYERVGLSVSGVDPKAGLTLPKRGMHSTGDRFAQEWTSQILHPGNPSLRRDEIRIVRLSDGKALGRLVSYSRIGGDMPGPWHESHFRCPEGVDEQALMRAVFVE
jgi:hypothetical protein